jgi:hypothetical protein
MFRRVQVRVLPQWAQEPKAGTPQPPHRHVFFEALGYLLAVDPMAPATPVILNENGLSSNSTLKMFALQ